MIIVNEMICAVRMEVADGIFLVYTQYFQRIYKLYTHNFFFFMFLLKNLEVKEKQRIRAYTFVFVLKRLWAEMHTGFQDEIVMENW